MDYKSNKDRLKPAPEPTYLDCVLSLVKKVIIIISILTLCCCNKSPEKTAAITENITESVYASGIIKAKDQYEAYSTVNGIISEIFVKENDLVKVGSPLIQISDETSKINSANSNLAADYANLHTNQDKLTDQKNTILLAETKYKNDSLLYIRQQNLWKENIGTKTDQEQKELSCKNSKNILESARLKYADLFRQLKFNEGQSRNNLAISKYKEGDLTVKSEMAGKVYFLSKERGEMINPQTALAIIGNADSFYLELQVDEYDIVKIREGQRVLVSMDSYKGETFEARVSKIDPIMNERTKSFLVEAAFVKQPKALYPNLTVEANIIIQTKSNALTIPRNYLVSDSLVLMKNNKRKRVITGLKDYQRVEIISGLSAGDIIYKPE